MINIIAGASDNERFDEVQNAFDLITNKRIEHYNNYISAAGKCGQFDKAQSEFAQASQNSLVNMDNYCAYLRATGIHLGFAEARKVFNEIVEQGMCDTTVYTALLHNDDFQAANTVFTETDWQRMADADAYNAILNYYASHNMPLQSIYLCFMSYKNQSSQ